ncbi:hypothetical protein E3T39_08525 [Cryobacterium suzukii]|uniref:Flagellar protein FlgN n=1 Tax=Cryobacterium suzukii TaxID=1259198 RepID=A0A4R9AGZ9_9MICO|nr:hypothetical protein [Cryobacterium suzukii]TFD60262.1 hypothetical protein E3T39_08525 [Cryobacterium suzukii]
MANLSAWEAALDDLEIRLDAAALSMAVGRSDSEAGSVGSGGVATGSTGEGGGVITPVEAAWTAPKGLGAIPAELAARVQDLLHNQQKLINELERARTLTLKHLTAVRSVPPERDARASVYLDVAG